MAIDSIGKRKSAASSRGGFRGGYVSSGAGDALEATSQQILTLLNAMPTTIDDALENYRSNGVASTNDLAVAAADAEQAVVLADATYTHVQSLPTASENADAVDAKLTTEHGAGEWAGGGSDLMGPGSDSVSIYIKDDGTGVDNVSVWITSDSAGSEVIAGTLTTDGAGKVTFLLTAGTTYYLWAQKSGKMSIMGQSFVAVAD